MAHDMTHLHFPHIQGKTIEIIEAIIHTKEVVSLGEEWSVIRLVVEELVINIVNYAYPDGNNDYLDVETDLTEDQITIRFRDSGVPFNPLEQESPDMSQPLRQRQIGGLGIFLVSKKMDHMTYERTDGENVLTVRKYIKH
jgi:anti-sigma regulatory factor (Ser/Thr protein kinase)